STACGSPAHLRGARARRLQTDLAPRAARALGVPAPMPTRAELEAREAAALAPYAMRSRDSRGRRHPEPEHPLRLAFQRDRDRLMKPHGGFDHNSQSLRIVDVLEDRYPAFRGLNLSWEVREGIVKHSTRYDRPQVREFDPELAPCLEAQIVDFADEIAYNAHDIDDGLKSGMLDPEDLARVRLWSEATAEVAPGAPPHVRHYQAVRRVIDRLVSDLCAALVARVRELRVETLADVRRVKPRLVEYSPEMAERNQELKAFLYDRLYTHYRVTRMTQKADRIMSALFEVYMQEPKQLPPHVTERAREEGESTPRAIADYVAGMTDRFALQEYKKLFDPEER